MSSTTLPRPRSDTTEGPGEVLGIRWVHPATRSTPLGRGLRIGRDEQNDIVLTGTQVSRSHAELARLGPVPVLRDLSSSNGTFVDGVPVREAPLDRGSLIRIGDWIGVVTLLSPTEQPPVFERFADGLFGGPILRRCIARAREASGSPLPVLLEGATGTGKERFARAVHGWTGRTGPFIAVNCATLSASLAPAELFGHRKGAFTGADRANPGYFQSANSGTLLLDELGDLPLNAQGALLRVLQEREVVPVGDARAVPIDVKLVAAIQEPLDRLVATGKLREDLAGRLMGWTIRLPLLRERIEELPFILGEKLRDRTGEPVALDAELVERLCLHTWPFNLRELDSVAERLAHRREPGRPLTVRDLPETFASGPALATACGEPAAPLQPLEVRPRSLRAFPSEAIQQLREALQKQDGNLTRAAAVLGISRPRAYRLLEASRRREH